LNEVDVASHPVGLSPKASAVLEYVTAHRDKDDVCTVSYAVLRGLTATVTVSGWLAELKAHNKIEYLGIVKHGVRVRVLNPPIRVARRRS